MNKKTILVCGVAVIIAILGTVIVMQTTAKTPFEKMMEADREARKASVEDIPSISIDDEEE
ncbi:hypothetical protein [Arhodomonas sp. AD133]|uniref:hypothetical protein n=1 Tax=Arhodomonas sp. AD133 TaxID=3415009 RepID=UPI003EB94351